MLDNCPHVGSRGAIGSLHEVGVLIADHGTADREAAQAEMIDQRPGRHLTRYRVDEHRACVLPTRLVLAPPPDDLGDGGLGDDWVAMGEEQAGSDHHLMVGDVGATHPQTDAIGGYPALPARVQIQEVSADESGGDVAAVPAGIHAHSAADRAWHADGPLETHQSRRRGAPGDHGHGNGPAGLDVDIVDDDRFDHCRQGDDDAGEP